MEDRTEQAPDSYDKLATELKSVKSELADRDQRIEALNKEVRKANKWAKEKTQEIRELKATVEAYELEDASRTPEAIEARRLRDMEATWQHILKGRNRK